MLANAGFAPVPAFSFNSPLVMGFLSLKKKRFSFEPDLALGLNGKPWLVNNWFRLAFIDRKKLKATVGLNPSLYFGEVVMLSGESIIRAHRNLTFEFAGEQTLTARWSLRWTYMLVHAFDTGAVSGQFFDVGSVISVLRIPKTMVVKVKPEVFYFNFDGNIDGFYGSGSIPPSCSAFRCRSTSRACNLFGPVSREPTTNGMRGLFMDFELLYNLHNPNLLLWKNSC